MSNIIRRLKADQEPLMPGVAYAGAAAIGGSLLVSRIRSLPVKILTPVACAAVAGSYFLPAHMDLIKNMYWTTPVHESSTTATMRDLKRSAEGTTFDLGHKTIETVDDVARQTKQSWDEIKHKAENLAESYREAGQEHVNKVVEKSVQEAKFWLDQQKAEADRLLNETASVLTSAAIPASTGEKSTSSRWTGWSKSDSIAPMKESTGKNTTTTTTTTTTAKPASSDSSKAKKVTVDRSIAGTAVKQYEATINRRSMVGKNSEATADKVFQSVVDAALPKERQGRHEKHTVDIARDATQKDYRDGKYQVRFTGEGEDMKAIPRKPEPPKDDHGLKNLEKRAHMLYNGVEHVEQAINKRVQKSLEAEADFWHQQSLKEEANARGRERGM